MSPKKFLLTFVSALLVATTNGQNPGIAVRINERGLYAVSEYGSQALTNYLNNFQIPNIVYQSYNIDNIRIVSIDLGTVSITPTAPNSITVSIKGASLEATASWRASLQVFFGENHFSGEVTVTLSGVSISQQVLVGKNRYSGPQLSVGACSASIETLTLKVHYTGWFSWLISSVVDSLNSVVKRQVTEKICPSLSRELKRYFLIGESQFPVNIPLKNLLLPFNNIDVNVGLTEAPEITNSSITVRIAGRCFNTMYNSDQRFSFSPPLIPAFSPSEKMAQSLVSQYVINTLLYSLWQNSGYLVKVNETQINSLAKVDINANVLADHISQFYFYINRPLEFSFQSPEAVSVFINSSDVTAVGSTNMVIYAIEADGQLEPVVAANFSISATFEVIIEDNNLFGNMKNFNIQTTSEGDAAIYFESILRNKKEQIIRRFNDQANTKKAKLVLFQQYQITNPAITYLTNAMEAAGGIEKI